MRSAETAERWKDLRKSTRREFSVVELSYSGIPGLEAGVLRIESPISAICGLNGVSKTTLLRALRASLDWESVKAEKFIEARLRQAQLSLTVNYRGERRRANLDIRNGIYNSEIPPDANFLHIDAPDQAVKFQTFFGSNTSTLDDLIEPGAMRALDDASRSLVNYICKKDYSTVSIGEIILADAEPIIFCRVIENDHHYDSITMSLGEISLFNIFWKVSQAPKGSLIIIEEPESFIAPSSQAALMDYLVSISVGRKLSLIVASHSPTIVSPLHSNEVSFFARMPGGAALVAADQFDRMRHLVGLQYPRKRVIFVEDRAARAFVKLLISKLDYKLSLEVYVSSVGGEAHIKNLLQTISADTNDIYFVGLFDGDMRGAIEIDNPRWPIRFLPGNNSIEAQFRSVICGNVEAGAQALKIRDDELSLILASLEGADDHDWFEDLGKRLGWTYDQVMMRLFDVWFQVPENAAACRELVEDLKAG